MTLEEKNNIINSIKKYQNRLSNVEVRPNIIDIENKAQEIKNFVDNPNSPEVGLLALVAPGDFLTIQFFEGWEIPDFEQLIKEISKL